MLVLGLYFPMYSLFCLGVLWASLIYGLLSFINFLNSQPASLQICLYPSSLSLSSGIPIKHTLDSFLSFFHSSLHASVQEISVYSSSSSLVFFLSWIHCANVSIEEILHCWYGIHIFLFLALLFEFFDSFHISLDILHLFLHLLHLFH